MPPQQEPSNRRAHQDLRIRKIPLSTRVWRTLRRAKQCSRMRPSSRRTTTPQRFEQRSDMRISTTVMTHPDKRPGRLRAKSPGSGPDTTCDQQREAENGLFRSHGRAARRAANHLSIAPDLPSLCDIPPVWVFFKMVHTHDVDTLFSNGCGGRTFYSLCPNPYPAPKFRATSPNPRPIALPPRCRPVRQLLRAAWPRVPRRRPKAT